MKKETSSEQHIQALIDREIDGEIDDTQRAALLARAEREPELARELKHAQLLQQALHQLPQQSAPPSLKHKLEQIGQEKAGLRLLDFSWWRWGALAAAIPLLLVFAIDFQTPEPSAAELEQGRRDLVVALGYLQGAGQQAAVKIDGSLMGAVVDPIRENTVRVLRSPIRIKEEYSL